jgi:hypothetical protein
MRHALNWALVNRAARRLGHRHTALRGARPDGALNPLTECSTEPVVEVRHHAGIVPVMVYAFDL